MVNMKRFALYLLRWQLSTPILWLVVRNLGVGIWSTIIANLIGGAIFFWAMRKFCQDAKTRSHKIFVENHETVCAGIIAGGAIVGIVLILIENVFLGGH